MDETTRNKMLPKFRSNDDIHIVVAGSEAVGAGWLGDRGDWLHACVTKNRRCDRKNSINCQK